MDILGAEGLDVVIILVSFASWWEGWALGGRGGHLGRRGSSPDLARSVFFARTGVRSPMHVAHYVPDL